jgi:large subunit ribosomal protein L4
MKAAALRGALSDRARDGRVAVIETFVDGETPSTKAALAALAAVATTEKVLVVLSAEDELNWISLRNVPTVHLLEASQLNTYDVLVADEVVFTTDALAEFLGGPLDIAAEDGYEPAAKAADKTAADNAADDADEDDADSDVDEADESSEESDK